MNKKPYIHAGKGVASLLGIVLIFTVIAGGCGISTQDRQKVQDLDYTVVDPNEVPESFQEQIDAKVENHFKLTYEDGEYLYIAVGYGEQTTGGYSIQVKDCYVSSNAIYFYTELYGPEKGETVCEAVTYPYIVIKTELRDEPVVFAAIQLPADQPEANV